MMSILVLVAELPVGRTPTGEDSFRDPAIQRPESSRFGAVVAQVVGEAATSHGEFSSVGVELVLAGVRQRLSRRADGVSPDR